MIVMIVMIVTYLQFLCPNYGGPNWGRDGPFVVFFWSEFAVFLQ